MSVTRIIGLGLIGLTVALMVMGCQDCGGENKSGDSTQVNGGPTGNAAMREEILYMATLRSKDPARTRDQLQRMLEKMGIEAQDGRLEVGKANLVNIPRQRYRSFSEDLEKFPNLEITQKRFQVAASLEPPVAFLFEFKPLEPEATAPSPE